MVGVLRQGVTLGSSEKRWQVQEGQVVVLPPHLPHHWFAEDGADLAVLHIEGVPRDVIDSLFPARQPRLLTPSQTIFNEYTSLFARLLDLNNQVTPSKVRLLHAYLEAFLLVLLQDDQDSSFSSMKEVATYLREHLREHISIDEVARLFCMSEATLRRHFLATFEMTPKQYLLELRLARAKELLTLSHLSIQEIAEIVGFPDLAHFSSTFRRRFGFAPSVWRASSYHR